MVTGQLTVPCDSLSNLCSHVQLFFSMYGIGQHGCSSAIYDDSYAAKHAPFPSAVFYFCSGGELLNQYQINQLY